MINVNEIEFVNLCINALANGLSTAGIPGNHFKKEASV